MFSSILRACLCFGFGAIGHFAMAPYNLSPILLVSFSGLYYVLLKSNGLTSKFINTWLFGFGYFIFGLQWIGNALLVPGNEEFLWAYPFALMGLPALLAIFPASCIAFFTRKLDFSNLSGWFGFVLALSISELARGFLFTGFPWNSYGYTWFSVAQIMQVASIGGIYFLSILTIFWASIPAFLFIYNATRNSRITISATAIVLFIACFLYGQIHIAKYKERIDPNIMIHVIQPNIPQHLKWDREAMANNHLQLIELTRRAIAPYKDKKNLIIWPETATVIQYLLRPDIANQLKPVLSQNPGNKLITGMLRFTQNDAGERTLYNSLSVFTPDLTLQSVYDKHHLVPFGEYIPFQNIIPISTVTKFSGFQAGTGPQILSIDANEASIIPMICYEAIFPQNSFPTTGDIPLTTFIVNVTNDGWYGNSNGPHQHMVQTIFRSVETGYPVIRSANTGISVIADPIGRILRKASYDTQEILSYPLLYPTNKRTIFSNNRTLLILALLAVLYGLVRLFIHKK